MTGDEEHGSNPESPTKEFVEYPNLAHIPSSVLEMLRDEDGNVSEGDRAKLEAIKMTPKGVEIGGRTFSVLNPSVDGSDVIS